ncbi:hypothetical protein MLD38_019660 [Melastoma candidum]|uniref:Uncharacterized protein n=1 Tax=Melastoma candidum TaxID=119954 RepID=A0ACB9R0T1_9MYRT|nr:hypothetical protein MLD38_019660 [Melastoma candidum]
MYIKGFERVPQNKDDLTRVVANQPVAASIMMTRSMYDYKGGIWTFDKKDPQEERKINHAVTVVGYGKKCGQPYWKIRNSYGIKWGENGYLRLEKETERYGLQERAVYHMLD